MRHTVLALLGLAALACLAGPGCVTAEVQRAALVARVTDAATGEALPGALVACYRSIAEPEASVAQLGSPIAAVVTDEDGDASSPSDWELRILTPFGCRPPGALVVRASLPGYLSAEVRFREDFGDRTLEIRLAPIGSSASSTVHIEEGDRGWTSAKRVGAVTLALLTGAPTTVLAVGTAPIWVPVMLIVLA